MNYLDIAKTKFDLLKDKTDVIILGIESSCDETACSVVKNGKEILSNCIFSQIDIHTLYGGVVPEIASRNHVEAIDIVVKKAIDDAKINIGDIDAIAVTYGAGLVGALLVGVAFAKSLAQALLVPLIAVNHIEGHICANYLTSPNLAPPYICLLTSGGHTAIVKVEDYTHYKILSTTVDDAVGEAFDKVARTVKLPYPGGPKIDKLSQGVTPTLLFPNVLLHDGNFSYSGLKTSVLNYIHKQTQNGIEVNIADICASFSAAAVIPLVEKSILECKKNNLTKLAVAGGVGANSLLRQTLTNAAKQNDIEIYLPTLELCTDNACMIASQGYFLCKANCGLADLTLNATPTLHLKRSN